MNKTYRLAILFAYLLSMLPASALYYDPNGVENPLDSDITENVRYVTYECKNARIAETGSKLNWRSTTVPLSAIYFDDGTVYLNQFLNSITGVGGSPAYKKYWIKGKLSDNGQYINIPVAQMVSTDPLSKPQLFYPFVLSVSDKEYTSAIDESTDTISLHIEDDGTLTPIGIDDTHGWGCWEAWWEDSWYVLFCGAFVPTEEQPLLPPSGLKKENYEFKFANPSESIEFGGIGKRVKMVFLNDTIFIQGCSYLRKEGWSVGRRNGDTYVFEYGQQPLTNVCLNGIKCETVSGGGVSSGHFHWTEYVSATDADVIFDFNPTTNSLSAQSPFWLYGPTRVLSFESDYSYGDYDIFNSAVFKKIPFGLQHPLPPDVKIKEKSGGQSIITVSGSYFDSDGYVMDVNSLFYRLYIDGIPYLFTQVEKWPTFDLAEPTELLPYDLLTIAIDSKDVPSAYEFEVTIPSTFREVTAELVYIQDGQEVSSGVNSVYEDSGSRGDSDDLFDMAGRRVNGQSLSPGVYIRHGQKFVVR